MAISPLSRVIPVSEPLLGSAEAENLSRALAEKALSGFFGTFIGSFEREFAAYCGANYGVAVNNGTSALHLALATLGIKSGDEVLVASLTNMATFFAVLYQGAIPIPVDIEADTLALDPHLLTAKITAKTKAIIVVHLFGHPVAMDAVMAIAGRHGLYVIEDAAQAHGAEYHGKKVGSIGDIGCFSFYANKIIATGEGGMLLTNNQDFAQRAASLKSLAFGGTNKFMHEAVGFNYRMPNIQAAIGCAQLTRIEEIIDKKRALAARYHQGLTELADLELPVEKPGVRNVYWMYHLVLKNRLASQRPALLQMLRQQGIETREGFIPYTLQEHLPGRNVCAQHPCPVAESMAYASFYLPSSPNLSPEEISYIIDCLRHNLAALSATAGKAL